MNTKRTPAPPRPASLTCASWAAAGPDVGVEPQYQATAEVYLSPKGGCTEAIVLVLDAAKKTVLVRAYRFTSKPILKALVEALKRGIMCSGKRRSLISAQQLQE